MLDSRLQEAFKSMGALSDASRSALEALHDQYFGISEEIIKLQPVIDKYFLGITALDESLKATLEQFQPQTQRIAEAVAAISAPFPPDYLRNIYSMAESSLEAFQMLQTTFNEPLMLKTEKSFSRFLSSYSDLYSLSEDATKLPDLPAVLLDFPPLEVFNSSRLAIDLYPSKTNSGEQTTAQPAPEPDDSFAAFLQAINPDFVPLWEGAKQSIASNNPDRVRHAVTSLRELFTQVLHHYAPDDVVRSWSTDSRHYHNNRPTRGARLEYICRSVMVAPFTDFVRKDMRLHLEFADLYQKGTHELVSCIATPGLNLFRVRTETAIRFLVQIVRLNSNN